MHMKWNSSSFQVLHDKDLSHLTNFHRISSYFVPENSRNCIKFLAIKTNLFNFSLFPSIPHSLLFPLLHLDNPYPSNRKLHYEDEWIRKDELFLCIRIKIERIYKIIDLFPLQLPAFIFSSRYAHYQHPISSSIVQSIILFFIWSINTMCLCICMYCCVLSITISFTWIRHFMWN